MGIQWVDTDLLHLSWMGERAGSPLIQTARIYVISLGSLSMGKCRHCPSCGKKRVCGNHHVYVIELKKEVLDDPSFCLIGR